MHFFRKLVLCGAILASLAYCPFASLASAGDAGISEQQAELVRDHCVSIKNTINQLHASDALLRVNRGQIYESMLTKLIDRFNSRLALNSFNNVSLVSSAGVYKGALENFRNDYKVYEEQLSATLVIDCSKQPADFYKSVIQAREKRQVVHNDIILLNTYIDRYKMDVLQFEKDYQFVAEGAKY